jgi:hypothetical protein
MDNQAYLVAWIVDIHYELLASSESNLTSRPRPYFIAHSDREQLLIKVEASGVDLGVVGNSTK